jgi:DNA-binding transcriptional regulator GbsR (MarR family)
MVAVIEALMWMQQPLSASEIAKLFGEPKHYYAGRASYYLKALRDLGLLEVTSVRPNRGALEHFFYFTEPK